MRLNLYLRGIDLVDVEFHAGSKGVYLDVNWFKPREETGSDDGRPLETTADLSSTPGGSFERAEPFGVPDTSVHSNGIDPDGRMAFGFGQGG